MKQVSLCCGVAGVEASVFDTQYDVQWMADGHLTGEPLRMPRTELFRKKPVVAKPMLKTWIAEVAACETVQVCCMPPAAAYITLLLPHPLPCLMWSFSACYFRPSSPPPLRFFLPYVSGCDTGAYMLQTL